MPRFVLPFLFVISLAVSACAERLALSRAAERFEVSTPPRMERLPPVGASSHGRIGAMTLMHAIGMALQNSDIVRVSSGGSVSADPSTAFDVDAADARILAALAEFDTSWESTFYTGSSKQPPNAFFGPGLTPLGMAGVLGTPQLSVVPFGKTFTVASNATWGGGAELASAFVSAGAFLLPSTSKDAAVVVRLPPGGYTVTVSGVAATTGRALVEIYDLDS